jgi:hypothetical protein
MGIADAEKKPRSAKGGWGLPPQRVQRRALAFLLFQSPDVKTLHSELAEKTPNTGKPVA